MSVLINMRVCFFNIMNAMNACCPRFLTFIPRIMTLTENLLIVGFKTNQCGIFRLDSENGAHNLVLDINHMLGEHVAKYVLEINDKKSKVSSSWDYEVSVENIVFSGDAIFINNKILSKNNSETYEISSKDDIQYFSSIKYTMGCIFLKILSYKNDDFVTNYVVLFVRFSKSEIIILAHLLIRNRESLSLVKCRMEQISPSYYVAYCTYNDSSMDIILCKIVNNHSTMDNIAYCISLQKNKYSSGAICDIIHINNSKHDKLFNCTMVIAQAFNITVVNWVVCAFDTVIEPNFKVLCDNNFEINGITSIKSLIKVNDNQLFYILEQGGLYLLDITFIANLKNHVLRLNTNYNLFHLDISFLGCIIFSFYHAPLPKNSRHGSNKGAGFLIDTIPYHGLCFGNHINCLLFNNPLLVNELKHFINWLFYCDESPEKANNVLNCMLDKLNEIYNGARKNLVQVCTIQNVIQYLTTLKLLSQKSYSTCNVHEICKSYAIVHHIEMRLIIMCVYFEKDLPELFSYIYKLYEEKSKNVDKKAYLHLSNNKLFLDCLEKTLFENTLTNVNMQILNICQYCIDLECSLRHFDYNEKELLPLNDRVWSHKTLLQCKVCSEMILSANLHYAYCINEHRIKRCQITYHIIDMDEMYLECIKCKMPFSLSVRNWLETIFNCIICVYCFSALECRI